MTRLRAAGVALMLAPLFLLPVGSVGSVAQATVPVDAEPGQSACASAGDCPDRSQPDHGRACRRDETWREVGVTYFPAPQGLLRSQGVTTDGRSWYFSWQGGLEHTTDTYLETAAMPMAIPPALAAQGSNHIGDIDYYQGALVVPIEDGPNYLHPYLARYDATTLLPLSYDPVSAQLQPDGVPWVAVDARRGEAMTARWDNPSQINVFDIGDHMRFLRAIPLQQPLSRIQGAKLLDGALIAAVDDTAKSVYRIDLSTGAATKLFSLNQVGELEGISVRPTPDGAILHVLFIRGSLRDPQNAQVSLHHWARTLPAGCARRPIT